MIDEKALDAAYEEYLAADRYDPYPDVIDILRAAITAYLDTAAPDTAQAVAAEREKCAQAAEAHFFHPIGQSIAAAIRARGAKP